MKSHLLPPRRNRIPLPSFFRVCVKLWTCKLWVSFSSILAGFHPFFKRGFLKRAYGEGRTVIFFLWRVHFNSRSEGFQTPCFWRYWDPKTYLKTTKPPNLRRYLEDVWVWDHCLGFFPSTKLEKVGLSIHLSNPQGGNKEGEYIVEIYPSPPANQQCSRWKESCLAGHFLAKVEKKQTTVSGTGIHPNLNYIPAPKWSISWGHQILR